jgi:hypothetical protein
VSKFRRRRRDDDTPTDETGPEETGADETVDQDAGGVAHDDHLGYDDGAEPRSAPAGRSSGPWDSTDIPDLASSGRVSLGGLWLPMADGLEVRVEADQETGRVIAVTLVLGDGALQVQPFAAPRHEGIWDEVRAEIRTGITQDGGTADEVEGPMGTELRTRVQVRAQDGKTGVEPARVLGVDGPRWFLRGVLTGRPAVEPDAGEPLLALFRDVVVVRGDGPMAPREPIALALPDDPAMEANEPAAEDPLSPFARGPEITEIR